MLTVLCVVLFTMFHVAHATEYTFTILADTTTDEFTWFSPFPVLNDAGEVAFLAAGPGFGSLAIYRTDGVTRTLIAEDPQADFLPPETYVYPVSPPPPGANVPFGPNAFSFGSGFDLNNAGQVAFWAQGRPTGTAKEGLFVGDGTGPAVPRLLVDCGTACAAFPTRGISLRTNGRILFTRIDTSGPGVFTQFGGAAPILRVASGPFPPDFTAFPGVPHSNGNGQIVFVADKGGIHGLYLLDLNVEPPSLTTIHESSFLEEFGTPETIGPYPAINEAGHVVYSVHHDADQTIFVWDGVVSTPLVTTVGGPYELLSFTASNLGTGWNDSGQVVFWATLEIDTEGLFTGPDPVTDLVIQTGQQIEGRTVGFLDNTGAALHINRRSLNNQGQMVFLAGLSGATSAAFPAIIRADPILPPDADGDGVADALDACPATRVPEAIPRANIQRGHYALRELPKFTGKGPQQETFTVAYTLGCNCRQVIAGLLPLTAAADKPDLQAQRDTGCLAATLHHWHALHPASTP